MEKKTKTLQWFSETQSYDMDTGEQVTSDEIKRKKYIIIKKTKKTEIHESTGIVKHTNQCRRSGQLEIKF